MPSPAGAAGDLADGAPLVVAADVDQQRARRLRAERLGRRRAAWQSRSRLYQQFIDRTRGAAIGRTRLGGH